MNRFEVWLNGTVSSFMTQHNLFAGSAMAERFSASDLRSDGRVVRMWVQILAVTVVLVSLSKAL